MNQNAMDEIVFWYRNYRGEEGYRRVCPISIRFGSSKWHKYPQWLLLAYDLEKLENREFAMRDIVSVEGEVSIIAIKGAQEQDARLSTFSKFLRAGTVTKGDHILKRLRDASSMFVEAANEIERLQDGLKAGAQACEEQEQLAYEARLKCEHLRKALGYCARAIEVENEAGPTTREALLLELQRRQIIALDALDDTREKAKEDKPAS